MILVDNLLILLPPKTGTTTVVNGVKGMRVGCAHVSNRKHWPLRRFLDVMRLPPGAGLTDLEVVMVSRRPEDRAMSLCRWVRRRNVALREAFSHPSEVITSGQFFAPIPEVPLWWLYSGPVVNYIQADWPVPVRHLFRLEDQLDDLADLLRSRTGKRPVFRHDNATPSVHQFAESSLTPEARARLLAEWGEDDWALWGYEQP